MKEKLPPTIIVKGGKDLDGTWGSSKTFTRETVFELINVPLPLFMITPMIPAYNSMHPLFPFAMAKDSKISSNVETPRGRAITVSTNYQVLKPATPLMGLSGFDIDAVIAGNMPFDLPAQDVSYESVAVEETINYLYIEKTEDEDEETEVEETEVEWSLTPFVTGSGTKLTGTRTRNILKMSFWYLADPLWFDEADIETTYTGVVNHAPVTIAGRDFSMGTVKIESIELIDDTWEREGADEFKMKRVQVSLLIDKATWCKEYENVSNLFIAYPYDWEDSDSGKENIKMKLDEEGYPYYLTEIEGKPVVPKAQRIFCTTYDPEPENEGDSEEPIWVSDPQKAIQFFGTREDCFRLNPDSEPTEVTEPMYLDKNGFVLYPNPDTGKVDPILSPKVTGYVFAPMDFTPLHFPVT